MLASDAAEDVASGLSLFEATARALHASVWVGIHSVVVSATACTKPEIRG